MSHGNEKPYFFSANEPGPDTLINRYPHCPCRHRHRTLTSAKKCATKNNRTHVYEMGRVETEAGTILKAVAVHRVDYISRAVKIEWS